MYIEQIPKTSIADFKLKRVAAYARASSDIKSSARSRSGTATTAMMTRNTPARRRSFQKMTLGRASSRHWGRYWPALRPQGAIARRARRRRLKLAAKLESARQAAKQALETALEDFRSEYSTAKQNTDSETFQKRYDMLAQKMDGKKAVLKAAEDAILANTARKVKLRRFIEATAGLTSETVVFSVELFIATVEDIRVSKVKNGAYTLEYRFMNGEILKLSK